jgi:hypothetical protein
MAIILFFTQSQACDISTVQDGNWSDGATWNTRNGLNCNINQNLVICINHNVTIDCSDLSLRSSVEVLMNTPGVTLTINGNVDMRGTASFSFASSTNIIINGNLQMSGNSKMNLDGNMHVTGNVSVANSAAFCGTGILSTDGSVSGVCGGLLPVEITTFSATALTNEILLQWVTASETNNDFFTVERSYNGIDFETVDFVTGAGSTTETKFYQFNDKNFSNKTEWIYYRIKQTDFDNSFSYTDIVSVSTEKIATKVIIYPNPVTEFVNVTVEIEGEPVEILILNTLGQIVLTKSMNQNNETLNLQNLSPGIYTLCIRKGGNTQCEKFQKI